MANTPPPPTSSAANLFSRDCTSLLQHNSNQFEPLTAIAVLEASLGPTLRHTIVELERQLRKQGFDVHVSFAGLGAI
jgi:hypothetical protein